MELRRRQSSRACRATIFAYRLDNTQTGVGDTEWLKSRVPEAAPELQLVVYLRGRSGGRLRGRFLGPRQHQPVDRNAVPLPTGGYLEQVHGTAWMALFSQNMMEISGELAMSDPSYADMTLKFVETLHADCLGDGPPGRRHRHVG